MGSTPSTIFSASQISGMLGLNPYVTKFHAYQKAMETLHPGFNKKKGYILPPFPDNAPIRWGLGFEDAIIKLAEEKFDTAIGMREELFTKTIGGISFSAHIDGAFGGALMTGDQKGIKFVPQVLHEGKSTWSRAYYSKRGEDCEVELELDGETGTYIKQEYHRRWGEPHTSGVPQEYQIQAAVQRICTGADLVKLSVLVFPKSTDEFEKLGWEIIEHTKNNYFIGKNGIALFDPLNWASVFAEIGNFHTYELPRDEALESAIIKAAQDFNENYILTGRPPKFEDYQDVRRFLTDPYGTIKATPELETKLRALSVAKHQVSSKGPHMKLIETLKVACSQIVADAIPDDASPSDKIEIVSASDGKILATFAKSGFRVTKGL